MNEAIAKLNVVIAELNLVTARLANHAAPDSVAGLLGQAKVDLAKATAALSAPPGRTRSQVTRIKGGEIS